MKRLVYLLLALLLLSGCNRNSSDNTTPSVPEGDLVRPQGSGLYLPGSYIEVQTGGAVKLCPLEKGDYEALVSVGDDLLLVKSGSATELMLLTGENLRVAATRKLNVPLSANTDLVQVADGVCAYYDEADKAVVFLNPMLAETSRLKLPRQICGTAYLSPDFSCVYYCTPEGVHALDMKTGVSRLLKAQTGTTQSVTGVLLNGTLLRVQAQREDGSKFTCMISANSGETVWEGAYLEGLTTAGQCYLMTVDSKSVQELVFGNAGEKPRNLWQEEAVFASALLPDGKILTCSELAWGSELALYDMATGYRIADVKLPGIRNIYSICAGAEGNIWMLGVEESTHRPVICGWDAEKSSVEDKTDYSEPHYTLSDYDEAGIRDCQTAVSLLEETYGVDILIGEDAVTRKLGGYGFACEYLVQAYERYLPLLEQALEMFPKELYTMAIEKTGNGVLHIGLVREIYGSAQYGTLPESSGVCFLQDGEVYMMLAMEKDLPYHFCRQLNLTMQSRILSECTAYYDWDALNPKDFRYDNEYIKNLDRTGDTYLKGDRAFIDTFSMSFATEDRATIFAYACFPGNETCFRSETMQAKLAKLCDGIRQTYMFADKDLLWEQYLQKKLPT